MKRNSIILGMGILVVMVIAGVVVMKKPLSPAIHTEKQLGSLEIKVDYSSPAVRDRKIWDGLLPYNVLWRAGANEATVFEFSEDVLIEEQEVKAGKYSFFVIPTSNDWTLILNSNWDQWGTKDYNSEHDIVRLSRVPRNLEKSRERLKYSIENNGDITLAWEKKEVSFRVSQKDL